jgi:type I restriction enzyme S subunit
MEPIAYIYDQRESLVFRRVTESFGDLSNMALGYPILINGIRIASSEALYQACRFPHLTDVQRVVLSEQDPLKAKLLSRTHSEHSRHDWEVVRVKIMRWCLQMKLANNWERFGDLLLSTRERIIVEYSKNDEFWGAKLYREHTLRGSNMLGRLLMELRQEMQERKPGEVWRFAPPDIPEFLLLGSHVGSIEVS